MGVYNPSSKNATAGTWRQGPKQRPQRGGSLACSNPLDCAGPPAQKVAPSVCWALPQKLAIRKMTKNCPQVKSGDHRSTWWRQLLRLTTETDNEVDFFWGGGSYLCGTYTCAHLQTGGLPASDIIPLTWSLSLQLRGGNSPVWVSHSAGVTGVTHLCATFYAGPGDSK